MTSQQFDNINKYLAVNENIDLKSEHQIRYNLINFFYKLKLNYDNYQLGKSICSIRTNWVIVDDDDKLKKNGLKLIESKKIYEFRPVLAALFYKYLFSIPTITGVYQNIIYSFKIEKEYKNNAKKYFKEQCQCDINYPINKENYKKYYFKQPQKYIGNK
jgi:hypothetical protein